jgi:ribosome-binding protein aMBF1 (putative translation factor)
VIVLRTANTFVIIVTAFADSKRSHDVNHDEVLTELLRDPEVRREWKNTTVARAIANQVVRFRVEHGPSQRALAERLGVSAALVGRLELGEHEPRISTLQLLTRRLGIRFSIDIHPEGAASLFSVHKTHVERAAAAGVETFVVAAV